MGSSLALRYTGESSTYFPAVFRHFCYLFFKSELEFLSLLNSCCLNHIANFVFQLVLIISRNKRKFWRSKLINSCISLSTPMYQESTMFPSPRITNMIKAQSLSLRNMQFIVEDRHTVNCFVLWWPSQLDMNMINAGLPRWLSGKESACNAGDMGSIPGSGRPPGGGHGYLVECSCLENLMDRTAWRTAVHRVAKSQTQLKLLSTLTWLILPG